MPRVLILTIAYPPANYVAGRRIEGWVRHLPAFGYTPFVLTRYYDPADRQGWDFQAPGRSPRTLNAPWVETNEAAYTNFTQDFWGRLPPSGKFGGLMFYALPDPRHAGWLKHCARYAEEMKFKPDLIVASYEPAVVFRIARRLSEKLSVPWVADYRDLWLGTFDETLVTRTKGWLQRHHVQSAAGITVATDGMAEAIRKQFPQWTKPLRVIYNGAEPLNHVLPDDQDAAAVARYEDILKRHRIVLTYTGTLYPQQPITAFLDAVGEFKRISDVTCAVLLCGKHDPAHYKDWGFVHIFEPVKHSTSIYFQKNSTANFYPTWPSTESIFSGKIFEQILSGRSVFVAFTPSSDLEAFCRRFRSVHVCKDPTHLIRSLTSLLHNKESVEFDSSYEVATKRYWTKELAGFFDDVLSTTPPKVKYSKS